ncbi:amino acid permease [Saxibacter everestensis]|uniref:Amino acid permease n=1 Tax=Saxibacter everestensis TaxID=2909229 RepID=A0ABY8QSH3_9MICO|nr:amino acid permease [Brevibacteriaceae bacterium ZFBP1038]
METKTDLKRSLSHRQMTMIALGSALGTGLFLGSGTAIGIAGPGVILAYIIGAVLAGIIGGALGEMTSRNPVRGAFGAQCAMYLGPSAGYLARWCYWAAAVIAIGGEVVAAATYLQFWWPQLPLWVGITFFALVIIAINVMSVRSFGVIEFFLSGIKVIALSVFILIGLLLIVFGLPETPATGLTAWTADGGFLPNGIGSVWLVMAVVMFSFVGVEMISISAAEAKEPERSVRTAMRTLLIRLAAFYVVSIAIIVAITPWRQAADVAGVQASPFVTVFTGVGIPAAASVTNIVVLIAAISAANANLYGSTRLLHSLAHDGLAPRPFRHTSTGGVPVPALLLSALGMVLAAVLAVSNVANIFVLLVSIATFGVLVTWVLILLAFISYRRSNPVGKAPYTLIGGIPAAVLGVIGIVGVAATAFVVPDMMTAAAVGIPFVAILTLIYFLLLRRRVRVEVG